MLVYKRVPYDRSLKLVKKMVAGERRSSTWKRGQGERCWHHQPPSGILISFFCPESGPNSARGCQQCGWWYPKGFFGAPYDPWHPCHPRNPIGKCQQAVLVVTTNWLSPISMVNSSRLFWAKATGDPYFHGKEKHSRFLEMFEETNRIYPKKQND